MCCNIPDFPYYKTENKIYKCNRCNDRGYIHNYNTYKSPLRMCMHSKTDKLIDELPTTEKCPEFNKD